MKRSKLILIVMSLLIAASVSGCSPLENYIVKDAPDYAKTANTPLTAVEYTNKINRTITPLMNDGETYIAHHLDIVKGKMPANQEIAMVDNTLNETQTAIEDIDAIYQPSQYSDHKAKTLMLLNQYKDSVRRYKDALTSGDANSINLAADGIKNSMSSLKTSFEVYQK